MMWSNKTLPFDDHISMLHAIQSGRCQEGMPGDRVCRFNTPLRPHYYLYLYVSFDSGAMRERRVHRRSQLNEHGRASKVDESFPAML